MTVMEMFLDVSNHIISTTSVDTKRQIEEKWQGNGDYQKIHKLLSSHYRKLQKDATSNSAIDPDRDLINQSHAGMYKGLKEAYDQDTDATITFINGYDFVCNKCIHDSDGTPPCLAMKHITSKEEPQMLIDDKVRSAHGWEYDKPYKVREILKTFFAESVRRKIDHLFIYDQMKDEDFLEEWEKDVRQSKMTA